MTEREPQEHARREREEGPRGAPAVLASSARPQRGGHEDRCPEVDALSEDAGALLRDREVPPEEAGEDPFQEARRRERPLRPLPRCEPRCALSEGKERLRRGELDSRQQGADEHADERP
jgi:hypothetical protein